MEQSADDKNLSASDVGAADDRAALGGDAGISPAKKQCTESFIVNVDAIPAKKQCTESIKSNSLPSINTKYTDDQFMITFKENYATKTPFEFEHQELLLTAPFPCCVLPRFITSNDYLQQLKEELLALDFHEKSNDLFKFHQSDDLKSTNLKLVTAIRDLLYNDVREWVSALTGVSLNSTLDLSCAKYEHTDTLLCHDDELEGRVIAFILYLVPPDWSTEDGGSLDLFNVDDKGAPSEVVKSLTPNWNQFVFFEVTPKSFHQVSEVLSCSKTRLTISGWFHGDTSLRPPPAMAPPVQRYTCRSIEEEFLYEWINTVYIDMDTQLLIQTKFEDEAEIQLQNFLQEEKYHAVQAAISDPSIQWTMVGPPNKRCYYTAQESQLPNVIKDILKFLRSDAMFVILSSLTGLSLHQEIGQRKIEENESLSLDGHEKSSTTDVISSTDDLDSTCCATCTYEVRKWTHGCYTLLCDKDSNTADFGLDLSLFFHCDEWSLDCGGYTSYFVNGEKEELLSIHPAVNALALAYRDKETMRFVKHVNHNITYKTPPEFYSIAMTFYEAKYGDDNLSDVNNSNYGNIINQSDTDDG